MSKMRKTTAGKVAWCGMLTALAMIFSYVEALIPINAGIPGIKLGLANLVVLTGLYYLSPSEVFLVNVCRILLTGFLFGSGMSILYSLAGGVLSFFVMLLLIRLDLFSPIGVSACGGAAHNTAQLLMACLVLGSSAPLAYLPVLLLAGTAAGILMGILSKALLYVFKHAA